MKVVLYTALTLNGLVAKRDGSTDWISKEDFAFFDDMCRKIGVVIVGRKTWDEMNPTYLPFKEGNGTYIIHTRNSTLRSLNPKTLYSIASATEILELLTKQGHEQAIVIGGSQTYGDFLQTGLVDEIYVDFEPHIFGQGINFFPERDFELNLELIETSKLNANTVHLHYKVVK